MFALQMYQAPRVTSFGEAISVYTRAQRHRPRTVASNGDLCYPIPGKENNRDLSVRMTAKGVAFRYHSTDVITWHRDGSYTYAPWNSRSTCSFFNQFCPIGTYLTRCGAVLIIDDTGYAPCGPVRVKDGKPSGGLTWFHRERVDRKAAKRVLAETRYAEYREWYKIMKPLLGDQQQRYFDAAEALEDESNWPMMASCHLGDGHPDRVRKAIYAYNHHECYKTETAESLPADQAHRSVWRV